MVKFYLPFFYRELKLLLAQFVETFHHCLLNLFSFVLISSFSKEECMLKLSICFLLYGFLTHPLLKFMSSLQRDYYLSLVCESKGCFTPSVFWFWVSIQLVGCALILLLSWVFFLVMKFLLKEFHILPLKEWKSV